MDCTDQGSIYLSALKDLDHKVAIDDLCEVCKGKTPTLGSPIISSSRAAQRSRKRGSRHHAAVPSCPAMVMRPAITLHARTLTPGGARERGMLRRSLC